MKTPMTIGSMTVEERAIRQALADAGWHGDSEVEVTGPDDDPRVHVRWDGRHVEAVSVEAAAAYILADARAKAAEADAIDRMADMIIEKCAEANRPEFPTVSAETAALMLDQFTEDE